MEVDISPEPTPEEREALLAALAETNGKPSAWWLAGIAEAVEEDDQYGPSRTASL